MSDTLLVSSEVTINADGSTIQPDPDSGAFPIIYAAYENSNLTINDATLANGTNNNNTGGAAIAIYGATMTLNRSTITGNTGGGVGFFLDAVGSINETNIIGNNSVEGAGYYGAGLVVSSSQVLTRYSTISNNRNSATIEGGAGIQVTNYPATVGFGNAVLNLYNTIIRQNISLTRGAGIFTYTAKSVAPASIAMVNVTLTLNESTGGAGGGLSSDGATVYTTQSLVSGNISSTGGSEIDVTGGVITANSDNLFGLDGDAGVVGMEAGEFDIVPDETSIEEILDVNLSDNGGHTLTHALAEGSPAIDAVISILCESTYDQTGKVRPIDADFDQVAECDIGAFENNNTDIIYINGFD